MVKRPSTIKHKAPEQDRQSDADALVDYSPRDKPWDKHRSDTQSIEQIYATAAEFERYAERMADCSGFLHFRWTTPDDESESRLKLHKTKFCRVRHCPVCQWRRSLMWKARFIKSVPEITRQYPTARWLMMTLTVRNCEVENLRETIQHMNQSWRRLKARKEFKPILGWIRTTEVTRGKDGSAHPHFHVLLLASPGYFKGQKYVKQSRWVELWRDCLRVGYSPNVDIRSIKTKLDRYTGAPEIDIKSVSEVLKYATKPDDSIKHPDWFLEMTRQTNRLRFIASGGELKDVLKEDKESDQEMVTTDSDEEEIDEFGSTLAFGWRRDERKYRRDSRADRSD